MTKIVEWDSVAQQQIEREATEEELAEIELRRSSPEVVPESVSRAQGKAALIKAGLWGKVLAYVAAITDPTQQALADVALNDTQQWRRDSVFLNAAAASLELPQLQLDALFIAASKEQF